MSLEQFLDLAEVEAKHRLKVRDEIASKLFLELVIGKFHFSNDPTWLMNCAKQALTISDHFREVYYEHPSKLKLDEKEFKNE